MKAAIIASIALSTISAIHVPQHSVTSYNLCIHDFECAVKNEKCCQAVMAGGDGVMLLRCGPWLDYSGYTGAINGYMYKCEDDMGASKLAAGVAAVATIIASLYWK